MEKRFNYQKVFMVIIMAILIMAAFSLPRSYAGEFDRFIMPVSNPIYHGDARNVTITM